MVDVPHPMLRVLLNMTEQAFERSAPERKRLHEVEWEGRSVRSVLGEVDIRADSVAGIVSGCLDGGPTDIEYASEVLKRNCMYASETIVSWVSSQGAAFPEFLSYIAAVESLRVGTLKYLEHRTNPDISPIR